jgi:hypothetical protein
MRALGEARIYERHAYRGMRWNRCVKDDITCEAAGVNQSQTIYATHCDFHSTNLYMSLRASLVYMEMKGIHRGHVHQISPKTTSKSYMEGVFVI